jgi:hypothetical protein
MTLATACSGVVTGPRLAAAEAPAEKAGAEGAALGAAALLAQPATAIIAARTAPMSIRGRQGISSIAVPTTTSPLQFP